jgi:hypothetical protein
VDLSGYADALLGFIENSDLSVWIREADYVFAGLIAIHLVGTGLVAAITIALNLQILSAVPGVTGRVINQYRGIFWTGLSISVVTGVMLVISYPAKELTNLLFYFKLLAIVLALITLRSTRKQVRMGLWDRQALVRAKLLAVSSLLLWAFVIAAGRFLAYTYTRLLLSD